MTKASKLYIFVKCEIITLACYFPQYPEGLTSYKVLKKVRLEVKLQVTLCYILIQLS